MTEQLHVVSTLVHGETSRAWSLVHAGDDGPVVLARGVADDHGHALELGEATFAAVSLRALGLDLELPAGVELVDPAADPAPPPDELATRQLERVAAEFGISPADLEQLGRLDPIDRLEILERLAVGGLDPAARFRLGRSVDR